MSEEKATERPWRFNRSTNGSDYAIYATVDGKLVSVTHTGDHDDMAPTEEDCELIIAAVNSYSPERGAAIKGLVEAVEKILTGLPTFKPEPIGPESYLGVANHAIHITVGHVRTLRSALSSIKATEPA